MKLFATNNPDLPLNVESPWTVVVLNGTARKHFPENWPQLQDMEGCPDLLKARVAQLL